MTLIGKVKDSINNIFGSKKSDGKAVEDVGEEEVFEVSNFHEPFDEIVTKLEMILFDQSFADLQNNFFDQYCMKFDETEEENKLEYTEIFHKYVELVEGYLGSKLEEELPWFQMSSFTQMLLERKNELEGELFDMLEDLSDFTCFKDSILSYKSSKKGDFGRIYVGGKQ